MPGDTRFGIDDLTPRAVIVIEIFHRGIGTGGIIVVKTLLGQTVLLIVSIFYIIRVTIVNRNQIIGPVLVRISCQRPVPITTVSRRPKSP